MENIRKAELYTDGSFNKDYPDLARGGIAIIFNDKPYAFVKLTTHKPIYTKQWNVGGELVAASFGLNMILNEIEKFRSAGFEVPNDITLIHDFIGIHDLVLPSKKTGKIWKSEKEGCVFYQQFYAEVKRRYPTDIVFEWVKSHTNVRWNEVVDMLAKGSWPYGYSSNEVIMQEVKF